MTTNRVEIIKKDKINQSNTDKVVFLPHRFGSFLLLVMVFSYCWSFMFMFESIISTIIYFVIGLFSLISAFYHFGNRENI